MKQLLIRPEIHAVDTFRDFAAEFGLGKEDLILTNEYIYTPYIKNWDNGCTVIFQEQYGTGEPTDLMVDEILKAVNAADCRRVIAVGGGTIIDIAKVLVLADAVNVDVLYDREKLTKDKQLIIIPTTCGTGSEVTNLSVINRTRKGTKMGLGSEAMFADYAVLIPEFLKTLPYNVFATSSIDALIHAAESYLSPKCTPFTEMFSIKAIETILQGYCRIFAKGVESRFEDSRSYLFASTYAGIAFGNSGCAAVHAMSYALGGKYHVPHGESNYQFFTDVLKRYKEKKPDGKIRDLEVLLSECILGAGYQMKMESCTGFDLLESLLADILDKKQMADYGATDADVEEFAASTIANQQRLLANNYVELTKEDIAAIYQARL